MREQVTQLGGKLEQALKECQWIEAWGDFEAFKIDNEVFRSSHQDVGAILVTHFLQEGYTCVMDFFTMLFLISDPCVDCKGVMSMENAQIKAGYKRQG